VLARMLGDTEPLLMRLRNPEGGLAERLLRARFALLGPRSLSQSEAAALVRQQLKPESPEDFRDFATDVGKHRADYRVFTVSTGTPPATMNLLLARLLGAEPLCVMTPSMLPRRLFALMIVPQHDLLGNWTHKNVLATTLALAYHDQAAAEMQASQLAKESDIDRSKAYWALAIGGPSKSVRWSEEDFKQEFLRLIKSVKEAQAALLITTSRRTTEATTQFAKSAGKECTDFFLDAKSDSRNPLPAFYELAHEMAVTDDSFSMICESIQAGFAPKLLKVGSQSYKLKHAVSRLAQLGLVEAGPNFYHGIEPSRFGTREPNLLYERLRAEIRAYLELE